MPSRFSSAQRSRSQSMDAGSGSAGTTTSGSSLTVRIDRSSHVCFVCLISVGKVVTNHDHGFKTEAGFHLADHFHRNGGSAGGGPFQAGNVVLIQIRVCQQRLEQGPGRLGVLFQDFDTVGRLDAHGLDLRDPAGTDRLLDLLQRRVAHLLPQREAIAQAQVGDVARLHDLRETRPGDRQPVRVALDVLGCQHQPLTRVQLRVAAGDRLDRLVAAARITIEPVTEAHARAACLAFRRYGRGSGSPARLNFGDCFAYALSATSGEPLLFKGDDFRATAIVAAAY